MPFLNDSTVKKTLSKRTLSYLCALTLLFSYAEMILPRVVPFFRLGLANTVMLFALDINFGSYVILSVLKATAASLMGGTLFSPFFLISLVQSFTSALIMRILYKLISKKAVSLYGISVAGSAVSAAVQIVLASLYIGKGTFALLGPMLIFNIASGIITAFFCEKSGIKENICLLEDDLKIISPVTQSSESGKVFEKPAFQIAAAFILLAVSVSVFCIKNLIALCFILALSLVAQKLSKRKIFILPHVSLWLFVFISSIFIPNGKVLFKLWNISVTQGAILLAFRKALTLSAVSALSQCAVSLKPDVNTTLGQSLEYFRIMSDRFRKAEGSIIKKIKFALNIFSSDVLFQQIQSDKLVQ